MADTAKEQEVTKLLTDIKLIQRICKGDPEAMDFLANHWSNYCHAVDDLVDGDCTDRVQIILTFGRALELWSHPFFLKHGVALRQVARNIAVMYAQTVQWEQCDDWRAQWSDHHRHCSIEMVTAVATICGGLAHALAVVPELRMMSYQEHHDQEGKPV